MIPIFHIADRKQAKEYQKRLKALRDSSTLDSQWFRLAADQIEAVRKHGDDAIVQAMQAFVDPSFTADRIVISSDQLADAAKQVDANLRESIERAIEHVRAYQQHIMPSDPSAVELGGAELGLRWSPIQPVGLCVPGGSAVLFSTLIMLAVPAMVAGVQPPNMTVVTPMPNRKANEPTRDVSPITLAVCHWLGIEKVYRIGGATAVAAMALGTQTISPVDFIAGPGHPIVQAAKLQLMGKVGIDGFYGASEIVTVADETASPKRVASDLIAQAEHDPGKCFLVVWSKQVAQDIAEQVQKQLAQRKRREAIEKSLKEESCVVVATDMGHAAELANELAGEHVNLAVADPQALLREIRNGGEFFLSDASPVASGDYYAGPSHCLPTGTTARFSSGVSVYTFLKRSGTVAYSSQMPLQAIEDIARMAEAEGLDGHAASVRTRQA